MRCCYRDTKMEIQGLTDAQNTHYQHGASRRTASSPLGLKVGRRLGSVSNENEIGDRTGLHEFQNDCNNNRPRTSRLRLLAENGSDACLAVYSRQGRSDPQTGTVELCNVNVTKEKGYSELELPADFVRGGLKYSDENVDNVLQMALPLFEAEDGYAGHTQRQPPRALRHQPQDGATQHQPLLSETTAASGSHPREASAARDSEEFYVVFNIVQENGRAAKERPVLSKGEEEVSAKRAVTLKPRTFSAMEVHGASALAGSDENLADLATSKTSSFSSFINSFSSSDQISEPDTLASVSERQEMCFEGDNSSIVLSNDIGGACSQQLATEMMAASCPVLLEQAPCEMAQHEARNSTALITEKTDASEVVDMTDAGNNVEYAPDLVSIPATGNGDRASEATPASAHETFSGTIMINNQSIIVTIENGVLTLAAPPEGYGYKEDGMVSLKEHLGMKDHEDIVLLNYDSGTKSIGKISNVASAQDEPKAGLSVSDSELTLADDCSLAGLSATLDSCAPVKQEDGAPCSVADGDPAAHGSRCAPMVCEDDLPAMGLVSAGGLAKKGALVTYRCPQPGCPNTFDTRQKLKMHLVFHTEDQRPFKCSVESCGWSFTTAYKLKRHLQSHDKVRPYACEWESCGRRFTTVYNLKAHVKAHEQEDAFACETCGERFRSATRLANHQRAHFEPERPHKCEFPGCEKTFITFSALFSHNRAHFRDTVQFTCTYPGCDKRYNKACRLKIHLRSHTGERPFVCDSEACGWTFTSMSKLLRHKRKHDDDRRFICQEKGCGKSFTRAEHLKGHSITHLGTKPFECPVEGCSAKFSARSSLYIHSKKHRQDGVTLRSRCPVAGCTKHFSSRSSLKSHMLKHHNLSADVLSQLETATSLTPSSELTSAIQSGPGASGPVGADLSSLDLSSLFSGVAPGAPATVAAGGAVGGSGPASFAMDMSLVSSGILTIDPASVGSALAGSKAMDPLILAAGADMGPHVLDAGLGAAGGVGVLPPATTLNLDDVQTVSAEALGSLTALALQGAVATSTATAVPGDQLQALSSSSALAAEPPAASLTATLAASAVLVPSPLGGAAAPGPGPVAELLSPQPKTDSAGPRGRSPGGPLLAGVEAALGQTEAGGKGLSRFVFPPHASAATAYGRTKDQELGSTTPGSFLESGGSARTDYRAIQLAKRRKQRGPGPTAGAGQRKSKGAKGSSSAVPLAPASARFGDGGASANGGLTIRDPVTGAQYVQIQLLQDDPATDGDLAFQLSSQTSSSHSQLTVDLPVNILQEPAAMAEDDNGSESSQFTGSTINLQDLE